MWLAAAGFVDVYGLWLLLRWYLSLQRCWWIQELEEDNEDEP
ncbi:MAG TPA: hypothetical protein VGO73_10515 [Pyrinomonadaceae bacterium]|jgi:hypothetical protein|nr:hypothetical protein [Pyrinomonadaceae bacterium]